MEVRGAHKARSLGLITGIYYICKSYAISLNFFIHWSVNFQTGWTGSPAFAKLNTCQVLAREVELGLRQGRAKMQLTLPLDMTGAWIDSRIMWETLISTFIVHHLTRSQQDRIRSRIYTLSWGARVLGDNSRLLWNYLRVDA